MESVSILDLSEYLVPHETGSDDDDDDDESVEDNTDANFDVSLTAQHTYLGDALEVTHGCTLFDEGSKINLPILVKTAVVLFPGQILPLTVLDVPTIMTLRKAIEKDNTIGIICLKDSLTNIWTISEIGTTAEIMEYSDDPITKEMKIKARGRQRFKLLSRQQQRTETFLGDVWIIPELTLPHVYDQAQLSSLNRFRMNKNFDKTLRHRDISGIAWPRWVLDQYDQNHLKKRLIEQLLALNFIKSEEGVPSDVVALSYWVARLLPVDDVHRVKMLSLQSAVERLHYALELLAECKDICCSHCGSQFASRRHILSTSADGPAGIYCNPNGYVHDIITLSNAKGLFLYGNAPKTEFSWFPGYGWIIVMCSSCETHVGWLFLAAKKDQKPEKFWGLRKSAITMGCKPVCAEYFQMLNVI